jgi:hypothetical protein
LGGHFISKLRRVIKKKKRRELRTVHYRQELHHLSMTLALVIPIIKVSLKIYSECFIYENHEGEILRWEQD